MEADAWEGLAACCNAEYPFDMEHDTIPAELTDTEQAEQPLVESELLVEEISIDGMCGVY